jgi:beta-lactam-binding protein with PASTA domain/tRNA A-37 threonylcarbamoyl transferase component Bud32
VVIRPHPTIEQKAPLALPAVASSRIADSVGRVLGGRYRLTRPLGTGASAHVYVAEDVTLRRRVAIKVLHPGLADDEGFLRRFRAEARVIAALRHPNILRVYDWGEDDGSPFLVSELLEGGSLRNLLDRGYLLTPAQATAIGYAAAAALDHAHRRGLVHRDVKPANLLFDDEGRVSVADFGLARALAEATWTEPAGAIIGTARYAAPEQMQGRALDSRADVYSLALVLTEATTGTVPFATDTSFGTLMARVERPLAVPESAGPLVPILEAAGTVSPEDRLDAAGLARALESLAQTLHPPAPMPLSGPLVDGRAEVDLHPTQIRVEGNARSPWAPAPGASVLVDRSSPEASGPVWPAPVVPADGDGGLQPDEGSTTTIPEIGPAAAPVTAVTAPVPAPTAPGAPAPAGASALAGSVLYDQGGGPAEPLAPAGEDGGAVDRPRRGRVRPVAVLLVLLVLAGAGVGVLLATRKPPMVSVPSLSGDTRAQAVAALEARHLTLAVAGRYYDASAPAGTVTGQTPRSGRVREHVTVAVTLSLGPQPVKVPALANLSQEEATKLLEVSGLSLGTVTKQTSISVTAGNVISASPSTGTLLPGRQVDLVVSAGLPSVVVPQLQGTQVQSYANAAAALQAAHLVPTEVLEYSNVVPAGEVVITSPGPDATVLYGSGVTVDVSKGPDLVDIPSDLPGQSVAAATAELVNDGFSVSGVTGNPSGKVRSSSPAPGSQVLYGSSVQLITH